MSYKEFFSTGDASNILNISRATISRKFDAGVLKGKKNPITGERLISYESLLSFLKKYNLPLDALEATSSKNIVVLSSQNKYLINLVNQSFPPHGNVKIIETDSIYNALLLLSNITPKLFIIDVEFQCADIVQSLKLKKVTKDMKIMCCLDSHNKKQRKDIKADDYLFVDTVDMDYVKKKISSILDIPIEQQTVEKSFDHNRRWPRIATDIPANLKIQFEKKYQPAKYGNSKIENISLGGAFLNDINFERGGLPLKDFRLFIEIDQKPLTNWKAESKIIRVKINGSFNAGVSFVDLSENNRNQILKLVE